LGGEIRRGESFCLPCRPLGRERLSGRDGDRLGEAEGEPSAVQLDGGRNDLAVERHLQVVGGDGEFELA
jgi:hypothetical protein